MKIAVTARGKTLDDQVDPRFGRCPYFLVVDSETLQAEAVENPNLALGGGAGIQSAQLMAEHDVKVVLTGNCGPNAYQTLNAAEIKVVVGAGGKICDAVEQFKSGALSSTQAPNVASHFGMGTDAGLPAPQADGQTAPGFPAPSETGSDIEALKAEAQNLEDQLQAVNARLAQIQTGAGQARLVAAVNDEKCTGCGLCASVCPVGAITVNAIAVIDTGRCTACGQCVAECPQDALTLRKA